MIFKKPYAFLIKYFKLINFLLAVLAGYVIYKTYNVVNFFNEFITSGYTGNFFPEFYKDYIPAFLFFIIILILIGLMGITLLFIYKKKPNKTYILSIIYYIILFVFLNVIKSLMISMETDVITAQTARAFRDLALLSILPQVYFLVLYFIRGLGYNIHKFNFKQDLKDLQISKEDSEEIEITIKKDGIKFKRNFRRLIREFIYYIKENKFIITILAVIGIILIIYFGYKLIPKGVNNNYTQGDSFTYQGIYYEVQDSIITNIDYKGDIISNENDYYLVVRIKIKNTNIDSYNIDFNKFRLDLNNTFIYPEREKIYSFVDYAKDSIGNRLRGESESIYAVIYKVKKKDIKKNYQIKVENGSTYVNNESVGKYNYFSINPIRIDEIVKEGEYNLGDTISFTNSNLKNSQLTLSNLELTERYNYTYQVCKNDTCSEYKDSIGIDYLKGNRLLLVFDCAFKIDETIPFYNVNGTLNKFLDSFIKIKYLEDGEEKEIQVKNVTPSNLEGKIVLETTNKIKDSEKLQLIIYIRNKQYVLNLK